MNINPGELNKVIFIYSPNNADPELDADGFETPKDTLVRICPARFSQRSGKEILASGGTLAQADVRFLVRHNPRKPLSEDMYIIYKKKRYEIKYINSYGDGGEYIEIWAERKERV